MKIAENTVVSITYELKMDDDQGQTIETVEQDKPFLFLFGAGSVLKDFETNLADKQAGDAFEFGIKSENAYGAFSEEAIVELPLSVFEVDGVLQKDVLVVGNYLTLRDHTGQPLRGKVQEVTDQNVKMDFNHPLAGQDLFFKGSVVEVREATDSELEHGHVHGPGGHQH